MLADGAASASVYAVYSDDDDQLGYETTPGEDVHDPLLPSRASQADGELTAGMRVVDTAMLSLSEDDERFDGDEVAHSDLRDGVPTYLDLEEGDEVRPHLDLRRE